MKTIKQQYRIKASLPDVWQALIDPKIIEQWGGGPTKMDDHVGTKFTLWDGDIHGTNLEVVKNKLLTQKWYGGEWEEPSTVTFTLKPSNEYTIIELIHKNVPEEEHDNISKGWKTYYLGPLKKLLENSPA